MSTAEGQAELAVSVAAEKRGKRRPRLPDTWWRHAIALIAVVVSLFPVAYIISAAFNGDNSLTGSSLIPRRVTLDNFRSLFEGQRETTGHATFAEAHYLSWFANSMIVAGATALLTVLLSALAAYAFSRFRFRGRRLGMMTLLLIQMFPQLLAIVAIYLIVFNTGEIFHFIGLNTLVALVVVYLGGAMGVNTWLMKGFFDTIPAELDESARVDGATPAQVFWGVVLPLAAPVLAVIALISFITTLNEFAIASVILQTQTKFTLPVADRRGSRSPAVRVPAALHRRGPDVRRGQGMSVLDKTVTLLDEPHHDGSDVYILERPAELGDEAVLRIQVPAAVDAVLLRYVGNGEARAVEARPDGEGWWIARMPMETPDVFYRWLLSGGEVGYAWRNGFGLVDHDVPDADDFVLTLDRGAPEWHAESVVYQVFPDRFASRPSGRSRATGKTVQPGAGRKRRTSGSGGICAVWSSISTTSSSSAPGCSISHPSSLPAARIATTRQRSSASIPCSVVTRRSCRSCAPRTRAAFVSSPT